MNVLRKLCERIEARAAARGRRRLVPPEDELTRETRAGISITRLAGELFTRSYLFRRPRIGVFLHRLTGPDDPQLHDHPWHNVTIVLTGGYVEEFFGPESASGGRRLVQRWRGPGSIVVRSARTPHRIAAVSKQVPTYTLFLVGRRFRRWGMIDVGAWRPMRNDQPLGGLP